MMVGGDPEPVQRLEPVFTALAPADGYAHVGASGAGHFMKMVHNGIEYGLMQAYAEGFEIMEHSEFELDLHEIAGLWRYGSVVRSWLLELLHDAFEKHGSNLDDYRSARRGLRRGPLDASRRSPRTCRRPSLRLALRPLRVARTRPTSRRRSSRRCATSSAATP